MFLRYIKYKFSFFKINCRERTNSKETKFSHGVVKNRIHALAEILFQ